MKSNRLYISYFVLCMTPSVIASELVPRDFDFQQMRRGGELFQQHCAACHGKNAEGTKEWRRPDASGKLPPPPLNGTAHTWHHPMEVLIDVIQNGTQRIGGNMPAWKEKLTEPQIRDIIAWLQARWSDEVYAAWYQIEKGTSK